MSYRRIFKKGSFDRNFRGIVPFLIVGRDWGQPGPSTPIISSKKSHQNFKMTILFNTVERLEIIFKDDTPPTTLRARVATYALGTYKVSIERVVV